MIYLILMRFIFCMGIGSTSPLPNAVYKNVMSQQETLKEKAFKVLKQKCNNCHATRKRVFIFTFKNMDSLSKSINEQVFFKQKMPRGRKNELTDLEKEDLINWIFGLNN